MVTYQDFKEVGESDADKMGFVRSAISRHKSSEEYQMALLAEDYFRRENRTINEYQKLLYTIEGQAVPDVWSSNFKMASGFFQRFVMQENQYLLGNGISWQDASTAERLGDDFGMRLQEAGEAALVAAVAFGFWNLDHMDVFKMSEFVPLYDETDGSLKAGIRFWQINNSKPLRATLYEIEGYTDYIWTTREEDKGAEQGGEVLHPRRAYKQIVRQSEVDGERIYDGENYPSFPIIPLWGNKLRQSEIVGLQEQIDCYDLIKSGFANTVDEASIIYWLVQNAGGMDDVDLVQFVEKVKNLHAANVGDGQAVSPHNIEPPYQSREALLARLRSDLYEDAMALDIKEIAGAATATQIKAAYENLDEKVNGYEWCVKEFLRDILAMAGIDDKPTFTRSILVNKAEEVQVVLQAAPYFDSEYTTRKLLTILGDADQFEEVMNRKAQEDMDRMSQMGALIEDEEEEAGSGALGDGQDAGETGEEAP